MRPVLVLILGLAFATPARASGDTESLPVDRPAYNGMIAASAAIARDFLGAHEACSGGVRFYYADLSGVAALDDDDVEAATEMNSCAVWLSRTWIRNPRSYNIRIVRCAIIVHELGHALLGLEHNMHDWRSIMFPAMSAYLRPCYERFRPRRVSMLRDRELNGPRAPWAIL